MDLDDVERIDAAAVGGGDTLTVGDASGTDLTALRFATGTDGAGDNVVGRRLERRRRHHGHRRAPA